MIFNNFSHFRFTGVVIFGIIFEGSFL
jgi:hypothetical protein